MKLEDFLTPNNYNRLKAISKYQEKEKQEKKLQEEAEQQRQHEELEIQQFTMAKDFIENLLLKLATYDEGKIKLPDITFFGNHFSHFTYLRNLNYNTTQYFKLDKDFLHDYMNRYIPGITITENTFGFSNGVESTTEYRCSYELDPKVFQNNNEQQLVKKRVPKE